MTAPIAELAGYAVTARDVDRAVAFARKLGRNAPHLADEFESAALVGLAEAARSFDPGRGVKFWSHAHTRVAGAVRDCARAWRPRGFGRKGAVPVVLSLSGPGGPGGEPVHEPPSGEDPVGSDAEWRDEVLGLSRRLPPVCRAAFVGAFAVRPTMRLVGLDARLSESRVSAILIESAAILSERFPDPAEVFMPGTNGVALPEDRPVIGLGRARRAGGPVGGVRGAGAPGRGAAPPARRPVMARTKPPKAGAPESQVMAAVVEAAAMFGVKLERSNVGAGVNPAGRLVRFGTPGDTDLRGILPGGRAMFVEVKAGGFDPARLHGQARAHFRDQRERMEELNAQGAVAFWVNDALDVVRALRILRDDPAAVVSFDCDGHVRFTYRETP